ncbi:hypothetical protein G3O01_44685 [Burkholderia sp. Ac-20365]|nr:hypothetical protein [Burkholderia sp. Ac-20365]
MRAREVIDVRRQRQRAAMAAETLTARARVGAAIGAILLIVTSGGVAMNMLRHVHRRSGGSGLRAVHHLFARVRAAHAEQRENTNEKKATQNRHERKTTRDEWTS